MYKRNDRGMEKSKHEKVRNNFKHPNVHAMYKMARGDVEKRRFVQALIHLVCSTAEDLSFYEEGTQDKLSNLYKNEERIPSYDHIIKVEDLQENKDLQGNQDIQENKNSLTTDCDRNAEASGGIENYDEKDDIDKKSPPPDEKEKEENLGNKIKERNQDVYEDQKDGNQNQNLEIDDHVYQIKQKGLAIVLYNTEFKNPDGTIDTERQRIHIGKKDLRTMEHFLPQFNIEIMEGGAELTKEEVGKYIDKVKIEIENRKPDIFICIVSTHGGIDRQAVSMGNRHTDGDVVKDQIRHQLYFKDIYTEPPFFTDLLIGNFRDKECPSLKGKPRLFFLQACSAQKKNLDVYDEGAELVYVCHEGTDGSMIDRQTDSMDHTEAKETFPLKADREDAIGHPPRSSGTDYQIDDVAPTMSSRCTTIPSACYKDCLIMFASPLGKFAFARDHQGGWLITSIGEAFEYWKEHPDHDITEILTRANGIISKKISQQTKKEYKSVASIQHMLTRELRLKAKAEKE